MGIEFLDGRITDEQYVVPLGMRANELQSMSDGEQTFVIADSLWMSPDGKLWIDGRADRRADNTVEPDEEEVPIRVFKLPEGFVVDISDEAGDFNDAETDYMAFQAMRFPVYDYEGFASKPLPVIGLLISKGEVECFCDLVKSIHGYEFKAAVSE